MLAAGEHRRTGKKRRMQGYSGKRTAFVRAIGRKERGDHTKVPVEPTRV